MKIVSEKQYTPEFWNAHRGVPSASSAKKVFTSQGKPSTSQSGYIAELIAQGYDITYGVFDEPATNAMRMGHLMEPEARAYYAFHRDLDLNTDVRQVGFITTDDGRFGCSPDALVGDDRGLECKSPQAAAQVRYLLAWKVPAEYVPQIHWSMVVTGLRRWDFISYHVGLPPLLIEVEANDYTEAMRAEMERFYAKLEKAREAIHEMADRGAIPLPTVEQYF